MRARETPAERIAAMKDRVRQKEDEAMAERERSYRREKAVRDYAIALCRLLNDLVGLPVTPQTGRTLIAPRVAVRYDGVAKTGTLTTSVCVTTGDGSINHETLIAFAVESDADGSFVTVTHDGDRIDDATALDLATAAVESRFRI